MKINDYITKKLQKMELFKITYILIILLTIYLIFYLSDFLIKSNIIGDATNKDE